MQESKLNIVRIAVMAVGGQKALAERLGVTQQYVSKWCKRGVVPESWAQKVSDVTGFDARVLTGIKKV